MLPSNSPSANTRRKMISSPTPQNKWGFWSNTPSPSPSPTTSPPPAPHPPSPQIDENIKKTETGYLFSNGELHWKKNRRLLYCENRNHSKRARNKYSLCFWKR